MGFPRSRTVDPTACAVYHCVSRCARRDFLIADAIRAAWIAQRLEFLASIFAIDVLEFSLPSNHLHLILRLQPELAWCWTDEEVAARWLLLRAAGPMGVAVAPSDVPTPEEIRDAAADAVTIDDWRARLADLGWFHKELKEPCARAWNREDHMEGCPFWQGRYTAKVALDDAALVCQALYVLLNPIRAGTESSVGVSERTSMGKRMKAIMTEIRAGKHEDAVARFGSRVDQGQWMPIFPCDPGSAVDLSDEEYSKRVARGKFRTSVRHAMRKEAETVARLATDAPVEELVPLVLRDASETQRPAPLPRHRLKPRASSMPPADVRPHESSWLTALENPFARSRLGDGEGSAVPILAGMTLGAIIRLADEEGRRERPDKKGRIAAETPNALDAFRAMALGEEVRAPAEAPVAASPASWLEGLAEELRAIATSAIETMTRHRALIASLIEAKPAAGDEASPLDSPDRADHPEYRVRWVGSACGHDRSLEAEAKRRATSRVVAARPIAV